MEHLNSVRICPSATKCNDATLGHLTHETVNMRFPEPLTNDEAIAAFVRMTHDKSAVSDARKKACLKMLSLRPSANSQTDLPASKQLDLRQTSPRAGRRINNPAKQAQ